MGLTRRNGRIDESLWPNCNDYDVPGTTTGDRIGKRNAVGLIHIANQNFQRGLSPLIGDTRRKSEIESFFNQLETSLAQRMDNQSILRLTSAIERDLAEELSVTEGSESTSEHQQYFATIRTLLSQVISEVNNGNYEQADQHAVSAYLDNYEYLEAPIEKHDPDLMLTIEEEMREELRTKKRMKKC